MKTPIKVLATIVAASIAASSMAAPASAFPFRWHHWHHHKHMKKVTPSGGKQGFPFIVGCVMGSALGAIWAASVKGGGLKWMSQAEFERTKRDPKKELTNEEAAAILFSCGALSPLVVAKYAAPR